MFEVTENFWLLWIAFGPFPLLQELLVPSEAVDVGVRIATRTGVAVPVPGAADSVSGFVHSNVQSQFVPQRLQHVQAGKARADHDCVEMLSCASHVLLQFCCLNQQEKIPARNFPSYLDPLEPANANGRRCIKMAPEILRD